ncbi:hypothetical protein CRG98_047175 [Punica granatum]|uniref:Uncharacterized protein n=1 Tax=Punica granatum TaxID=22663 RepID=A0A2I0HL48_PUNGR|nr:hypothetical protein CRG98_047175 [Punica granatum]
MVSKLRLRVARPRACAHPHRDRPNMFECSQRVRLVLVLPHPSKEDEPGSRSIIEGGCLRARDNVYAEIDHTLHVRAGVEE